MQILEVVTDILDVRTSWYLDMTSWQTSWKSFNQFFKIIWFDDLIHKLQGVPKCFSSLLAILENPGNLWIPCVLDQLFWVWQNAFVPITSKETIDYRLLDHSHVSRMQGGNWSLQAGGLLRFFDLALMTDAGEVILAGGRGLCDELVWHVALTRALGLVAGLIGLGGLLGQVTLGGLLW